MVAAVELHLWRGHSRPWAQRPDLLQPDDLSPEFMRLFHIADIDHDMVDTDR
jgi:hypothetical protein